MSQACSVQKYRQLTFDDIKKMIQLPSTPTKKVKTAGKKQIEEREPVVVLDRDCSKNAAMKCCCCIHTNGKGMWFPSCPRTLKVGEIRPKIQNAYGKMTTRELIDDVKKYSCTHWELGNPQSCFTCEHHDHTDVLKLSCPSLKGKGRGKFRDGKEADNLMMKSRKELCENWIPKAGAKP